MRKVPTTDRGGRIHRIGLRQLNASVALSVQQLPQLGLLSVIGARRITWSGTDAMVFLTNELSVGQRLLCRISPMLPAYALMEMLSGRFGKTVRQGFQHDARIVIVPARKPGKMLLDSNARCDSESPNVIANTRRLWRDVIGE